MEFAQPFGRWLKRRRMVLDLTQEDLARQLGYACVTIRKFETGARRPSRQAAEFLADCLHIPAGDRAAFIAFARGAEYPRWHLAIPSTPLIGRAKDVELAIGLLRRDDVRLLNLVGPPGVGKTRLAQEVARQAGNAFANGVCFVGLASVGEPGLVGPAIAEALQIGRARDRSVEELLAVYLSDKQALLLLDNFEHLVPASPMVAALLARAPGLKVLVTSRAMLHLTGEHIFEVAPLATPGPGLCPSAQSMLAYPAVELFVERARQTKPSFALTDSNARAVTELCYGLDGLPLAIELAAAHVRAFNPQTILTRLDHHAGAKLRFLGTGARDRPPRQQTLRATLDWSYDLLSHDEQSVLRQLGVFAGGCTLEAVEAVCDPGAASGQILEAERVQERDAARLLELLVEKCLVREVETAAGKSRYIMLETVREYALEKLEACGEAEEARRRHGSYFARTCELDLDSPAWPVVCTGLLKGFAGERDNLYAALDWSRGCADESLLHLQLSTVVGWLVHVGTWYLGLHGDSRAIASEVEWSLGRNPGAPVALRAVALQLLGLIRPGLGDPDGATQVVAQSLQLSLSVGLLGIAASALHGSGWVAYSAEDLAGAEEHFAWQLALGEQTGSPGWVLNGLSMLGNLALEKKDFERAGELLARALALARSMGVRTDILGGEAVVLKDLGLLAYEQGDYAQAYELGRQALLLFEEEGVALRHIQQHLLLGRSALALQRPELAEQHLAESLRHALAYGYRAHYVLILLAQVAAQRGATPRYARLAGAASRRLPGKPAFSTMFSVLEQKRCLAELAETKARLGDAAFAAAWAEGQAMSDEQAVEYALSTIPDTA